MANDWLDQMDEYESFLAYIRTNDKTQYERVILAEKVKKYLVKINKDKENTEEH